MRSMTYPNDPSFYQTRDPTGREARILVNAKKKQFARRHDLRRSMADRLVDSGLLLDVVQEILRHVDLKTTKKYDITRKVQRTATQMLEAIESTAPSVENTLHANIRHH